MGTWKKLAYEDDVILKSLLTERGSVIYRNASAPAELLHGTLGQVLTSGGHGADPSWATAAGGTLIKVKTETRDLAAAAGNVAYTGYGFTPQALIIFANIAASGSIGCSDSALAVIGIHIKFSSYGAAGAFIILLETASGKFSTAIVASYDPDGFTLTWTKTSTPTGVANLTVFALK